MQLTIGVALVELDVPADPAVPVERAAAAEAHVGAAAAAELVARVAGAVAHPVGAGSQAGRRVDGIAAGAGARVGAGAGLLDLAVLEPLGGRTLGRRRRRALVAGGQAGLLHEADGQVLGQLAELGGREALVGVGLARLDLLGLGQRVGTELRAGLLLARLLRDGVLLEALRRAALLVVLGELVLLHGPRLAARLELVVGVLLQARPERALLGVRVRHELVRLGLGLLDGLVLLQVLGRELVRRHLLASRTAQSLGLGLAVLLQLRVLARHEVVLLLRLELVRVLLSRTTQSLSIGVLLQLLVLGWLELVPLHLVRVELAWSRLALLLLLGRIELALLLRVELLRVLARTELLARVELLRVLASLADLAALTELAAAAAELALRVGAEVLLVLAGYEDGHEDAGIVTVAATIVAANESDVDLLPVTRGLQTWVELRHAVELEPFAAEVEALGDELAFDALRAAVGPGDNGFVALWRPVRSN